MSNILVQPQQLRQKAEILRAHAQKIDQALLTIDQTLMSLKGDFFLGLRADAVQTRYAPQKEALLQAKNMVLQFSDELNTIAERFSAADVEQTGDFGLPAEICEETPESLKKRWKDIQEDVEEKVRKYAELQAEYDRLEIAIGEGGMEELLGLWIEITPYIRDDVFSDIISLLDNPEEFAIKKILELLVEAAVDVGVQAAGVVAKLLKLVGYSAVNVAPYSIDVIKNSLEMWVINSDMEDLYNEIQQLHGKQEELANQIIGGVAPPIPSIVPTPSPLL
jgi:uncharacterized protein YukE